MSATVTLKRNHAQRLRSLTLDIDRLGTSLERSQAKRADLIRTAANDGASFREIAEAAGISHQRVGQILSVPLASNDRSQEA